MNELSNKLGIRLTAVRYCTVCERPFVDYDKLHAHEKICIAVKQAELDKAWEEDKNRE